jgi:hypothetical protein
MNSRVGTPFSSPWWVGLLRTRPAGLEDGRAPRRLRRGLLGDLLGGALMLAVWILLWSFFAVAVVEPAARVHGARVEAARPALVRA